MRFLPIVRASFARGVRAKAWTPPVVPPPPANEYWGSYMVNGSYSHSALPASVQTYAQDAENIWNSVWATENMAMYGYTMEGLSQRPQAFDFRTSTPHAHGVLDNVWMTGNPAYLTHAESFVANQCASLVGAGSIEDIFGGRILNPDAQNENTGWVGIALDEPFFYSSLAMYARLLHENGVNPSLVATAVTRIQEHWRRWQRDVWLDGGNPTLAWGPVGSRTAGAGASLTHADPNPLYRNFNHVQSQLVTSAHCLYKITGNANYKTGYTALLNHIGYSVGAEVGVIPVRLSWSHMPNDTFSNAGYAGQTTSYPYLGLPPMMHYMDRENELDGIWPYGGDEAARGFAHFALRDAGDYADYIRGDMAGGCGAACTADGDVTVTPFTAGGIWEEANGTLIVTQKATERLQNSITGDRIWRNWWTSTPFSEWQRTYLLGQRGVTGQHYWRSPASPVGFILHEMRLLS